MAAPIRTRSLIVAAALLAAVASPLPCVGHFMAPIDVPAARVIANIKARLDKSPSDAEAWYNLGRVHAYLVTHGGSNVPVQSPDEPTRLYDLSGPKAAAAPASTKPPNTPRRPSTPSTAPSAFVRRRPRIAMPSRASPRLPCP